jgi:hypothetical protein
MPENLYPPVNPANRFHPQKFHSDIVHSTQLRICNLRGWRRGVKPTLVTLIETLVNSVGLTPLPPLQSRWSKVQGFKSPSERSRAGCIIKDTVVMLSERPNVRVHNDPLRMCPARESEGRDPQGRLSWGYTFFAAKEEGYEKHF